MDGKGLGIHHALMSKVPNFTYSGVVVNHWSHHLLWSQLLLGTAALLQEIRAAKSWLKSPFLEMLD